MYYLCVCASERQVQLSWVIWLRITRRRQTKPPPEPSSLQVSLLEDKAASKLTHIAAGGMQFLHGSWMEANLSSLPLGSLHGLWHPIWPLTSSKSASKKYQKEYHKTEASSSV